MFGQLRQRLPAAEEEQEQQQSAPFLSAASAALGAGKQTVRRASNTVELYGGGRKSVRWFRRLLWTVQVPLAILVTALGFSINSSRLLGEAIFLWLLTAALFLLVKKSWRNHGRPWLTLSNEGIVVDAALGRIGLLRWDEIASIRQTRLLFHRGIGISVRDIRAVARRTKKATAFSLAADSLMRRSVFRVLVRRLPHLFIAARALDRSPDEMLALIAQFPGGRQALELDNQNSARYSVNRITK